MENYIPIDNKLPWRKSFVYLDTEDYLADSLFINEKVKIKFRAHYERKGTKYIFIFASCSKKDWPRTEKALSNLGNKMLLFGHDDYESYLQFIKDKVKEERRKDECRKKHRNKCNET